MKVTNINDFLQRIAPMAHEAGIDINNVQVLRNARMQRKFDSAKDHKFKKVKLGADLYKKAQEENMSFTDLLEREDPSDAVSIVLRRLPL